METITIETLWVARVSESTPELAAARDEFTIDNWREGWDEACQKALASYGSDINAHRYITLLIDMDQIERAFEPPSVEAKVR